MSRIPEHKLPPDQRTYLNRSKKKPIDGGTMAFVLGILILIGFIYLAVITPGIVNSITENLLGDNSAFLSDGLGNSSTEFTIDGKTYDTKKLVFDFFRNLSVPVP